MLPPLNSLKRRAPPIPAILPASNRPLARPPLPHKLSTCRGEISGGPTPHTRPASWPQALAASTQWALHVSTFFMVGRWWRARCVTSERAEPGNSHRHQGRRRKRMIQRVPDPATAGCQESFIKSSVGDRNPFLAERVGRWTLDPGI